MLDYYPDERIWVVTAFTKLLNWDGAFRLLVYVMTDPETMEHKQLPVLVPAVRECYEKMTGANIDTPAKWNDIIRPYIEEALTSLIKDVDSYKDELYNKLYDEFFDNKILTFIGAWEGTFDDDRTFLYADLQRILTDFLGEKNAGEKLKALEKRGHSITYDPYPRKWFLVQIAAAIILGWGIVGHYSSAFFGAGFLSMIAHVAGTIAGFIFLAPHGGNRYYQDYYKHQGKLSKIIMAALIVPAIIIGLLRWNT